MPEISYKVKEETRRILELLAEEGPLSAEDIIEMRMSAYWEKHKDEYDPHTGERLVNNVSHTGASERAPKEQRFDGLLKTRRIIIEKCVLAEFEKHGYTQGNPMSITPEGKEMLKILKAQIAAEKAAKKAAGVEPGAEKAAEKELGKKELEVPEPEAKETLRVNASGKLKKFSLNGNGNGRTVVHQKRPADSQKTR